MNDEWVETTLGEVAEINMGQQLSPARSAGNRLRPYLRAANVSPGHISSTDVNEMHFSSKEEERHQLRVGDVLLVEGGNEKSVGSPALVTEEVAGLCMQNTLLRLRVRDSGMLEPGFLLLSMMGLFSSGYFASLAKGTTIMHLGAKRVPPVPISLPPLPVQRRIVDLMAHLDNHLANLRTERELLRSVLEATAEHLIAEHQPRRVREIAHPDKGLVGGPFGSSLVSKDYVDVGTPVIRGTNMPKGSIYVGGDFAFVSEEKAASLSRNQARPGDVIFTQRGTLGQVGLMPENIAKAVVSQSQMRLRVDDSKALPEYVFFAFSRPSVVRAIQEMNIATANPHINLGILAEMKFPVPELTTQHEITSTLFALYAAYESAGLEEASLRRMRESTLSDLLDGSVEILSTYDALHSEVA